MKKLIVLSLILVVGLYGAQAFAQEDALEVLGEPGEVGPGSEGLEEPDGPAWEHQQGTVNREDGLNTARDAVGSDPSEGDLPDVAENGIGGPGSPPSSFGPGSVGPGSFGPGSVGPGSFGPGSVGPGSFGPGSFGPGSVGPGSVGGGAAGGRR